MGRKRSFAYERAEAGKPRLQRAEADAARDDVGPVQGEVLRLQREGGNEAVAGVLARKTHPGELDSKTKERQPGEKRAKVVHMDGIGDFPLLSSTTPDGNEVKITIPDAGAAIVELQKRATDGRPIETVVIDLGGATFTLKNVYISSLTYGGAGQDGSGPVSLTLNFGHIDVDYGD